MKRLRDRKSISLISFALPFLFCIISAQAQSHADGTCESERLNSMVAQADIAEFYSPGTTSVVGTIENMVGKAVILRGDHRSGYRARQGDAIHMGDTLITRAESSLRLKFRNEDIAILGACTNLHIYRFKDDKLNHKKTASLKSSAGNLVFYVLRLFGYREIKFDVQTPSRVASVRGTKFGISVNGAIGNHANWIVGNAPMEKEGTTDCFCDSGSVEIDRKIVHGGTIYKGDSRSVFLLTVDDAIEFQRQFKRSMTPFIMNTISPPKDDQHHAGTPKIPGLDGASDDRKLEKRGRELLDAASPIQDDDLGGNDNSGDKGDDNSGDNDDAPGRDSDAGGGDGDNNNDADDGNGRGDDNDDQGDDGNGQSDDNDDQGDDGNGQSDDNDDQGDDGNGRGNDNDDRGDDGNDRDDDDDDDD